MYSFRPSRLIADVKSILPDVPRTPPPSYEALYDPGEEPQGTLTEGGVEGGGVRVLSSPNHSPLVEPSRSGTPPPPTLEPLQGPSSSKVQVQLPTPSPPRPVPVDPRRRPKKATPAPAPTPVVVGKKKVHFTVPEKHDQPDRPKAYSQSHTFGDINSKPEPCRICPPEVTGNRRCLRCGRCTTCGARIFCKGAEQAETTSATGHVNRLSERMDRAIWEAFRNPHQQPPDTCFFPIFALVKYANQDVNFGRKSKNETALMAASFTGVYDVAKELLELGADPNVETHGDGYTAWTFANKYNYPRIMDLLENPKSHGIKANVPPLLKKPVMASPSNPNNPTTLPPQVPGAPPQLPGLPSQVPLPMPPTGSFASTGTKVTPPGGPDEGSSPATDMTSSSSSSSEADCVVRLHHLTTPGPANRS